MPPPRTLAEVVEALARVPTERGVTFVDDRFRETRATWRDVHARAAEIAEDLRRGGAAPGEPVLLPLEPTRDSVAALLGTFLAGAVPATTPRRTPSASASRDPVSALQRLHGFRTFEAARADVARAASRHEPPSPDDLALIQFSSGTTRAPRGVELSHSAVLANLRAARALDARDASAVHVTWLPLSHDMGLVGGLLASLLEGHELVLMDPACFVLKPVSWLESLSRHRATSTAAPDFALAIVADRVPESQLARRGLDLSALRSVFDGAEPVRPATVRRFQARLEDHGLRPNAVRPVYGLAEATLVVTAPEQGEPLVEREVDGAAVAGVGRPIDGVEVRIARRGGGGGPPPAGEVGEICVRGPSLARGYHADPAATREAFVDGWLRTGDLGLLDEDGRLFVTGRLKDLLIVAGRNFYAHEIGAVVDELPFARRGHSHAVAVPRAGGSEEVVVLLAPAHPLARRVSAAAERVAGSLARLGPGGGAVGALVAAAGRRARGLLASDRDPARLERLSREWLGSVRRHVQHELGLAVDRVTVVPRLPKTTSGKVRREACLDLARSAPGTEGRSR